MANRRKRVSKPEPIAVTITEAARMTGLGRTSLYMAVKNGHLRVRKAGRRTLVETEALRGFIRSLPDPYGETDH